jgi:hypothetical protein
MDAFLQLIRSKTVWGAIIIGVAQLQTFSDYRDQLMAVGIGLLGAGIAHKLDKINTSVKENDPR